MPNQVHMLLPIQPKYAVSQVVGYIKGKSAIHLTRVYGERQSNFVGQHFWARGFFVNTAGRDEEAIRTYIRNQEREDQRLEQLNLWADRPPLGGPKPKGPRKRPLLPL
jgi:putative transposase